MRTLDREQSEDGCLHFAQPIQRLLQIEIAEAERMVRADLPPVLYLQRLWPQSDAHFIVEYVDEAGHRMVGQWCKDRQHFLHLVKETACAGSTSSAGVLPLPAWNILLQLGGADRKLPGLAALIAQPDARLIVHHPERRAVVCLHGMNGVRYAKVVRTTRVVELAVVMRTMRTLAGFRFATPEVLAVHEEQGVIMLSALAGVSLHELLGSATMVAAAGGAGQVLRTLHRLPPPTAARKHASEDEIKVLQRWLDRLAIVAPALFRLADEKRETIFRQLLAGTSPSVLLHRDFYDKQILHAPDGTLGLLDFDTLATGEPALDVANALVHFELRALEAACTQAQTTAAATAFCASYCTEGAQAQRYQAYADATRLRLACVYACRPAGLRLSPRLLACIGTPLL